jgi:hypothetical protein
MEAPGGIADLTLFGQDPGEDYAAWIDQRVPGATVVLWTQFPTHYPHLMFPTRFVQFVLDFDATATQGLCL